MITVQGSEFGKWLYMIFIFVYQEIFQQLQAILAGHKLQSVRDSKFCQLLPGKRTLKLSKLIIIIIVCGLSNFVLVNLKSCCTEMFFSVLKSLLPFHVVTMKSNY